MIGVKKNGHPLKMTVTEYWESKQASLLYSTAMKLAVFATSGADIERLVSQARAAFDYFMGGCKTGTMSDRLFVKINRRVLKAEAVAYPARDAQTRAVITGRRIVGLRGRWPSRLCERCFPAAIPVRAWFPPGLGTSAKSPQSRD